MRQAKGGTTKSGLGQIVDAASIRERPAEADDRAVPGHWEGDLLCGANNTHIVTLVERHTRFVMLLKVPSKDTATVVAALGKHVNYEPCCIDRLNPPPILAGAVPESAASRFAGRVVLECLDDPIP